MGCIYKLTFPNGAKYVGMTISTAEKRFQGHKRSALVLKSDCLVHKAWRKHGEPCVEELFHSQDRNELAEAEKRFIKELKTMTPNGYNLTPGGDFSPSLLPEVAAKIAAGRRGWRHTQEVKDLISSKKMGQPSPRKGATHTEESKAKMSASHKGLVQTKIHRARSSVSSATTWAIKLGREFSYLEKNE